MVFSASLKIFFSFLLFSLLMDYPSHEYVIIGMIMASTICHMAFIFIPLYSALLVSARIVAVAPLTFFSISVMWPDRLPLLFMTSPRYL